MTPIIAAYLRVSTDDQAERGTIETQRVEVMAWAARRGVEVQVFEDAGVSGMLPLELRPASSAMLRALFSGEVSGLVVWKLDRLARDPAIVLPFTRALEARGLALHSVTESFDFTTPAGELTSTITAAAARYERRVFIERSIAGTRRLALQDGRWLGGIVPFGYVKRVDGTLEIDERPLPDVGVSQADIVREVFRRSADGWSTTRIADDLNARAVPTVYARDGREAVQGDILGTRAPRDGKRKRATACVWTASSVQRLLLAPIYMGRHRYGLRTKSKREPIERVMPAIVSPALFAAAASGKDARMRWDRAKPRRTYLLRGVLSCSCGHALVGQAYAGKGGAEVRVYRCASHSTNERRPRVFDEVATDRIWGRILEFFRSPNEVLRSRMRRRVDPVAAEERVERELVSLGEEMRALDEQDDRITDAIANGLGSPDALTRRTADIAARRDAVTRKMATLRDTREAAARVVTESKAVLKRLTVLAARAANADDATKAALIRELVASARVSWEPDGRARVDVVYRFEASEHRAPLGRLREPMSVAGDAATEAERWRIPVLREAYVLPEPEPRVYETALSLATEARIRSRWLAGGVSQKALADEYGVGAATLHRIVHAGVARRWPARSVKKQPMQASEDDVETGFDEA